jgi:hypothetical protein
LLVFSLHLFTELAAGDHLLEIVIRYEICAVKGGRGLVWVLLGYWRWAGWRLVRMALLMRLVII